jgi:hypothetical protein
MKFLDMALIGIGAIAGSDLAGQYGPASLDVGALPVRKYGGGAAGAYAAGYFGGHKLTPIEALIAGGGAVFASDLAGGYLPATIDVAGLPVRRYGVAAAAVAGLAYAGVIRKG